MKACIRFFLVASLLSGCGEPLDQSSAGPAQTLADCPGLASTGSPRLVSGAQCGQLGVPLDPSQSNGPSIDLNILRLPAIAAEPDTDPLFIIAGGPGQSAVDLAEYLSNVLGALRRTRDLVFVDQRGTGQSKPLNCDGLPEFNPGLDVIHQQQEYLRAIEKCAQTHGARTKYFTTPYAVNDLEQVRQLLGYPEINLWGASYGTRVALTYLQEYPGNARSVVLDGLAPTTIALPWYVGRDSKRALMLLDQHCLKHDACAQHYGKVWQKAQEVAERLEQHPAQLLLEHPRTGSPLEVTLTDEAFAGVLRMALYSRELSQLLPSAITRAHGRDYRAIAALWLLSETQQAQAGIALGMHYTVLCNEDFPQIADRDPEQAEDFLGLNAVITIAEICALWPQHPIPADYFAPVLSDVPVLLLSGDLDPITPPLWAEEVAADFSNALHLIVPGGHHGVTHEGCLRRIIHRFIRSGNHHDLDTTCIDDIQPRPALVRPRETQKHHAEEGQPRDRD